MDIGLPTFLAILLVFFLASLPVKGPIFDAARWLCEIIYLPISCVILVIAFLFYINWR